MSFADTLLPLAEGLIDDTFGVSILYQRVIHGGYDPVTGQVTASTVDREIKAAVLSTGRREQGGVMEDRELRLWVHHGPSGLQIFPATADRIEYLGLWWKVTAVDPTYSGAALVASKLTCEREA